MLLNNHGNKSKQAIISLIRTEAYLSYNLRQKWMGHFHPTLFFHFWPVSSSSQCCLSQLTSSPNLAHQHCERKTRRQSVPTILSETVARNEGKDVNIGLNVRVWYSCFPYQRISSLCPLYADVCIPGDDWPWCAYEYEEGKVLIFFCSGAHKLLMLTHAYAWN